MTRPGAILSETAEDLREYFLLRDAERRAGAIAEATRADFARRVEIARQKREAAEALWAHGVPAEALVLARDAAMLELEAAEKSGIEPTPAHVELRKLAEKRELPDLDRDVTEGDAELFRQLIQLHRELDVAVGPVALDAKGRTRMRVARILVAATFALSALAAFVWWVRKPGPVRTDASAAWSAKFGPQNAVDGADSTEWLLPDTQPGWIDFSFPKARHVKVVKLLNGTNRSEPIRAVGEFELEIWAGGTLLKKIPGSLAPYTTTPSVRVIDLGVGEKVTRIRMNVRTWFGSGAALAEASFE